jgi:hypothetical protein
MRLAMPRLAQNFPPRYRSPRNVVHRSLQIYLISKRSELGKIILEHPLLAVAEAKKDNFSAGWAQCGLEMIAIQKINRDDDLSVHGLVSNGEIWKMARLTGKTFVFYNKRFVIEELDALFDAVSSILESCKLELAAKLQ